jgi:hypothetical protein
LFGKARAPRMQPPRQQKAEPVPTQWRSLSVPRGLMTAYALATKCRKHRPTRAGVVGAVLRQGPLSSDGPNLRRGRFLFCSTTRSVISKRRNIAPAVLTNDSLGLDELCAVGTFLLTPTVLPRQNIETPNPQWTITGMTTIPRIKVGIWPLPSSLPPNIPNALIRHRRVDNGVRDSPLSPATPAAHRCHDASLARIHKKSAPNHKT